MIAPPSPQHTDQSVESPSPQADMNMAEPVLCAVETEEEAYQAVIARVLRDHPRYIGVYAPGDFKVGTYRLVLPEPNCGRRGRGFRGMREEIVLESETRVPLDRLVKELKELADAKGTPLAVRHILNPSTNKDEGIRLVWPENGQMGEMETADWPRRDRMIREGKTVVAMEGGYGWIPDMVLHRGPGMALDLGYSPECHQGPWGVELPVYLDLGDPGTQLPLTCPHSHLVVKEDPNVTHAEKLGESGWTLPNEAMGFPWEDDNDKRDVLNMHPVE